jgi:hypothetical protein
VDERGGDGQFLNCRLFNPQGGGQTGAHYKGFTGRNGLQKPVFRAGIGINLASTTTSGQGLTVGFSPGSFFQDTLGCALIK